MKGIVLAGGAGTRLYPATRAISKQLLPVYDKPMIYYPISVLMLAGIREILVISTVSDLPRFEEMLGDGGQLGMRFHYAAQPRPEGIAQAFLVGEQFIGADSVCLILGDNIFYGDQLRRKVRNAAELKSGGVIFAYSVSEPEQYGVVAFDEGGRVTVIEEKPEQPKSRYAVTGLYFYDNRIVETVRAIAPSGRGELEITDVNRAYLRRGQLSVDLLGRGMAWLDMGTYDSLLNASNFIATIEHRQGWKIACLEEIAYREGWISAGQLAALAPEMQQNGYGHYLLSVVAEGTVSQSGRTYGTGR